MPYRLIEPEPAGTHRNEVDAEGLREIVEDAAPAMQGYRDPYNTALVALGYRDGAEIDLVTRSVARAESFAESLADMGVRCAVEQDPDPTADMTGGYRVQLFLTRDSAYDTEDFEAMGRGDRDWGSFLGYPDEAVEDWHAHQRWKRTLQDPAPAPVAREDVARPPVRPAYRVAEEHGAPVEDVARVGRLISFMVSDIADDADMVRDRARHYHDALSAAEDAYDLEDGYLTDIREPITTDPGGEQQAAPG